MSQTQKTKIKVKISSIEGDEFIKDENGNSWFVMFEGNKNDFVVSYMKDGKVTSGIAYKDDNIIMHD